MSGMNGSPAWRSRLRAHLLAMPPADLAEVVLVITETVRPVLKEFDVPADDSPIDLTFLLGADVVVVNGHIVRDQIGRLLRFALDRLCEERPFEGTYGWAFHGGSNPHRFHCLKTDLKNALGDAAPGCGCAIEQTKTGLRGRYELKLGARVRIAGTVAQTLELLHEAKACVAGGRHRDALAAIAQAVENMPTQLRGYRLFCQVAERIERAGDELDPRLTTVEMGVRKATVWLKSLKESLENSPASEARREIDEDLSMLFEATDHAGRLRAGSMTENRTVNPLNELMSWIAPDSKHTPESMAALRRIRCTAEYQEIFDRTADRIRPLLLEEISESRIEGMLLDALLDAGSSGSFSAFPEPNRSPSWLGETAERWARIFENRPGFESSG